MKVRRAVTNAVFLGTVVVLLIFSGIGYSLYFISMPAGHETSVMTVTTDAMMVTESMNHTTTQTMAEGSTSAVTESAVQFTPAPGQMVHSAWALIEPAGSGMYAVSVHAEGLESTQGTGNVYIVEATSASGSMSVAPIGPNGTSSEFETTGSGVGDFFVLLGQNPYSAFESIEIVYLPGMQMSNGTVVATASLTMMQ